MEKRPRLLPCPENLVSICSAPDGPRTDKHHDLAQSLNKLARVQKRSKEYRNLLATVVSHPMNGVQICWCLHHKYGVQGMSETELPTSGELQGRLERWDEQ